MSISDGDYELAIKIVLESSNASCSHLQRKLNWGYARASMAIDRMEREFIVGAMSTAGKRDVLPPCVHELWEKSQQQEKEIQALKIGGVPEGFVLLPKTPTALTDEVLGFMPYNLPIPAMAQIFRKSGVDLPKKIEKEQAYVVQRILVLAMEHGDQWRSILNDELKAINEMSEDKQS